MGELADDMTDGTTCSLCGCFFVVDETEGAAIFTHGYPAVCWDCWEGLTKRERREHQRALRPTL